MEIIRQKNSEKKCGQCCVAMITGFHLDDIVEKYGHASTSNFKDAKRVLNEIGYDTGNVVVVDNRTKYELPNLALVRIERIGRKNGHFVVHFGGKFYDSCEGVFYSRKEFVDFYRKDKWRIRQYMEVIC